MLTHLSLEQCLKLKEWGYPQEKPLFVYDYSTDYYGGKDREYGMRLWQVWNGYKCDSGYHNWDSDWTTPTDEACACPTTDELKAWILEKWPSIGGVMVERIGDKREADHHVEVWTWEWATGSDANDQVKGSTELEALYSLVQTLRENNT